MRDRERIRRRAPAVRLCALGVLALAFGLLSCRTAPGSAPPGTPPGGARGAAPPPERSPDESEAVNVPWSPGWSTLTREAGGPGRVGLRPPIGSVIAAPGGAMIASANALATWAGAEVLTAGGTAIQAAFAAQLVLNVVEPESSGIGGGCFILYYDAKRQAIDAIDGREELPSGADPKMFLAAGGTPIPFRPDRITGGRPVGVPGTLAAFLLALKRHAPAATTVVDAPAPVAYTTLFRRAIALSERGFRISPRLALAIRDNRERLARFPASAALYLRADRTPKGVGEVLVNPAFAATLKLLSGSPKAAFGAFYRGDLARDIAAAVTEAPVAPGTMTREDLARYRAVPREPVRGRYRGYEIVGMPPPTSGGTTLIEILQILATFPPEQLTPLDSVAAIHRIAQAEAIAYADRAAALGDPDFVDVPVARLIDPAFAAERAALFDATRARRAFAAGVPVAAPKPAPAEPSAPSGDTTPDVPANPGDAPGATPGDDEGRQTSHLVVVDRQGNIACITTTIESTFGSAMVVPGRGFVLNNELTDFDATPSWPDGTPRANAVTSGRRPRHGRGGIEYGRGGKRPRSSMSPTLVLRDGAPVLALGTPGGSRIIGITAWTMLAVLQEGLDPQSAINRPRALCRDPKGAAIEIEPPFGADRPLIDALEELGHTVRPGGWLGAVQAIAIDPRTHRLSGGADPRREGAVLAVPPAD